MWQIHTDETKSSLQFASRALRVTNCAKVNEVSPEHFPILKSSFILIMLFLFWYFVLLFCLLCVLLSVVILSLPFSLINFFLRESIFITSQAGSVIDEKIFLLSMFFSDYAFCHMLYDLVLLCTEVYVSV